MHRHGARHAREDVVLRGRDLLDGLGRGRRAIANFEKRIFYNKFKRHLLLIAPVAAKLHEIIRNNHKKMTLSMKALKCFFFERNFAK